MVLGSDSISGEVFFFILRGRVDDLSQARWNWLIMFLKGFFFCCRCTAAAVPQQNVQMSTDFKERVVKPNTSPRRLQLASGLIAVCFRRGSRGELRVVFYFYSLLLFFFFFGTARSTSFFPSFLYLPSLTLSPTQTTPNSTKRESSLSCFRSSLCFCCCLLCYRRGAAHTITHTHTRSLSLSPATVKNFRFR